MTTLTLREHWAARSRLTKVASWATVTCPIAKAKSTAAFLVLGAVLTSAMLLGAAPSALAQGPPWFSLTGSKNASTTSWSVISLPVAPSSATTAPAISAPAAYVIDARSGRTLFSLNANARLPIASTTKIMTAVLVLEMLPLNREIVASAQAAATLGSSIGLKEGETLTAEQLLYALLVESANDAAVALAEAAAGSVETFVDLMNKKAVFLGLENTHFVNPHGMNAKKHYSSARDLAVLTQYAMRDDTFREMVDTWTYTIPRPFSPEASESTESAESANSDHPTESTESADSTDESGLLTITNRNVLLGRLSWVTGVKTGFTPNAGYCLVASGTKDGTSLISVLLGQSDENLCWAESQALLEYGLNCYHQVNVTTKGKPVTDMGIPFESSRRLRLVANRTLTLSLHEDDVATRTIRADPEVTLPVNAGNVLGVVEVKVNGELVDSVDLVAAESVGRVTIEQILRYLSDRCPPRPSRPSWLRPAS